MNQFNIVSVNSTPSCQDEKEQDNNPTNKKYLIFIQFIRKTFLLQRFLFGSEEKLLKNFLEKKKKN